MIRRHRHAQSTELLTRLAQEVRAGVVLISQLLGTPAGERRTHREELLGLEGRAMDLHFTLMTHIRSVFLTPMPREDIYSMSQHLNRTLEHVVAAGDLILTREHTSLPTSCADQIETLGRQVELTEEAMGKLEDFDFLEDYWTHMHRLTKQANRTHREWVTSTDSAFQPNIALQQLELSTELLHAVHAQRALAGLCGSIIVRES